MKHRDSEEGQRVVRMQKQKSSEQIKKQEIQQQEIQNLLLYLSWNEMGILDGGTLSRIAADSCGRARAVKAAMTKIERG